MSPGPPPGLRVTGEGTRRWADRSLPGLSQCLRISESAPPGTELRHTGDYQVLTPQKSLEAQSLISKLASPRPARHTPALRSPATSTVSRQPLPRPTTGLALCAHVPLCWELHVNDSHTCIPTWARRTSRASRTEVVQCSGHDIMRWGQPQPSAREEGSCLGLNDLPCCLACKLPLGISTGMCPAPHAPHILLPPPPAASTPAVFLPSPWRPCSWPPLSKFSPRSVPGTSCHSFSLQASPFAAVYPQTPTQDAPNQV